MNVDLKMENIAFSVLKTKGLWRTSSDLLFKILDFGLGQYNNIAVVLRVVVLTFPAASVPEDRHRTITNLTGEVRNLG